MLISTVKKIFGTRNDRELKRMRKVVARINALEEAMQALDDNALRAKTDEFRSRLSEGDIAGWGNTPRRMRAAPHYITFTIINKNI